MLPLRARVDLGTMAMKGYSAFPKAPALVGFHVCVDVYIAIIMKKTPPNECPDIRH